jgi:hypothetical protein
MACVWGTLGVASLLDWLGVPRRHQIARESVLDSGAQDELDGLVLLDLPDHDSTQDEHRTTVERLIERVDVFVWVVDPQKYADAALHERYLRPLATHRTVTAVVLNQIDRLSPADVKRCVEDLREIVDQDGHTGVPILPMSALTGEGVDQFTDLLRNAVSKQRAHDDRIAADVRVAAKTLQEAGGTEDGKDDETAGAIGEGERDRLISALAEAAGINAVAEAVGRSYLGRARRTTGWPLTRWIGKLRRDPLRSLGIGRGSAPDLPHTSFPAPTPVQQAQSDTAIRRLGDAASASAPRPWRVSIRQAARNAAAGLPDALDQAIASADLDTEAKPRWWKAVNALQWLGLAAAIGGALWLVAVGLGEFLRFEVPMPEAGGIAMPTLLLISGLLLGVVFGTAAFALAKAGARRRTAAALGRLSDAVALAADDIVIKPVEAELDRFRSFRRAARVAASR